MPILLKSILGSLVGALIGAFLAIAGVLLWIFYLRPPNFRTDSDAMAFGLMLSIFAGMAAVAGAVTGMVIGLAVVLWCSQRRHLAAATLCAGCAIGAWVYGSNVVSILLILPSIVLILAHYRWRKTTNGTP
jgi:hypothetical protein